MSRLIALGLLALMAACGPNPKAPVKVMAMLPSVTGALTTKEIELTSVTNVTTLKGPWVEFVGSTRVVVDPNDPTQQLNGGLQNMSDDQRYEVIMKDKGGDVRGHYVERSGVLWPADFHTWNMVSTYYNFERAYLYFVDVYAGVDPKELRPMRVQYWADVKLNSATSLLDNALYLSFVKSFVVTPFQTQQLVPFSMNIGVVGHEVAHRVFNFKALRDAGVPTALGVWSLQAFNWLKSLDEGLADYHGFSVTCGEDAQCRPGFLGDSISDERTVAFRNVAKADACMDNDLRTAFQNADQTAWVSSPNMYKVGSLVAASLYFAGEKSGKRQDLQRALIKAYDDDSAMTPGIRQLIENSETDAKLGATKFTPENVVDIIAAHVTDPELKKRVCNEFSTRLQLRCGQWPCMIDGVASMPHCPGTSARENTCPKLDQP